MLSTLANASKFGGIIELARLGILSFLLMLRGHYQEVTVRHEDIKDRTENPLSQAVILILSLQYNSPYLQLED